MSYPRLDSESGTVIVVALVATIIGSILAGSYMTVVISESRNSVRQKQSAQSLFLAEAGIEKGLYYLNHPLEIGNPWTGEYGGILEEPSLVSQTLAEGRYEASLEPWSPPDLYLIRSTGIIPRDNSDDIDYRVSCLAGKLKELPIPAALGILDAADPEDELIKFASSQWTIDGTDMDALGGLPGIAVANTGDDLPTQLGSRLDQVTGSDEWGNFYQGVDAILEDTSLSLDLSAYVNYFRRMAIDVSGMGSIPSALLGTPDEYEILYADLSQGPLKIAGTDKGSGVLVLEGDGEFTMSGGAEWNGVIICASNSNVLFKGGASVPAHIYGALLIADGVIEMNGTVDIQYSSSCHSKINLQLILYQVYSWSGGWGNAL